MNIQNQIINWHESLDYQFVRWEQLPELDLYMDQLVFYVEKQLGALTSKEEKVITSSMINNYVKHGLINKPIKKKYQRQHLADLMAITLLKQVIPLPNIKTALDHLKMIYGEEAAYNQFCDVMESALTLVFKSCEFNQKEFNIEVMNESNLSIALAAFAFASKILSIKVIELQGEQYE